MGYQNHGLIGEVAKKFYNTLVTGLSMALGISIASSFKTIALNFRWYILSRKKRPIEEVSNPRSFLRECWQLQVNSILACNSLTEVSILGAKSARKPGILLSCSLWVIFNIVGCGPSHSLLFRSHDVLGWPSCCCHAGIDFLFNPFPIRRPIESCSWTSHLQQHDSIIWRHHRWRLDCNEPTCSTYSEISNCFL